MKSYNEVKSLDVMGILRTAIRQHKFESFVKLVIETIRFNVHGVVFLIRQKCEAQVCHGSDCSLYSLRVIAAGCIRLELLSNPYR